MEASEQVPRYKSKALEPIDELLKSRGNISFSTELIQIMKAVVMADEREVSWQKDMNNATWLLEQLHECLCIRMNEIYQLTERNEVDF
ncbi:MAG: hypothetical protein ABJH98_10720 [Reichenbachiella sp.]|uniref:hypothetical protein n=1 Tax=Reichenbachiella sp. TaxID=2184521 RepID=UPI0032987618